jgi:hypothetical protein
MSRCTPPTYVRGGIIPSGRRFEMPPGVAAPILMPDDDEALMRC